MKKEKVSFIALILISVFFISTTIFFYSENKKQQEYEELSSGVDEYFETQIRELILEQTAKDQQTLFIFPQNIVAVTDGEEIIASSENRVYIFNPEQDQKNLQLSSNNELCVFSDTLHTKSAQYTIKAEEQFSGLHIILSSTSLENTQCTITLSGLSESYSQNIEVRVTVRS